VAGDLIFSKLEQELAKSKGSSGAMNVKALGRDDSCVVAARKIFDAVDADASGTVSSQELLDSDLLRSLGQCTECTCGKEGSCESVKRFMDEIDKTLRRGNCTSMSSYLPHTCCMKAMLPNRCLEETTLLKSL
jgi:hypothetical protein